MALRFSICLLFSLTSCVVCAQEDDTIRFNQGLPEAGTDSSLYDDVNLDKPPRHYRKIDITKIPGALKKELESDPLFSGWENRTLWLNERTGLYWIDFTEGAGVRSYGFTAEGNIVSVKETSGVQK